MTRLELLLACVFIAASGYLAWWGCMATMIPAPTTGPGSVDLPDDTTRVAAAAHGDLGYPRLAGATVSVAHRFHLVDVHGAVGAHATFDPFLYSEGFVSVGAGFHLLDDPHLRLGVSVDGTLFTQPPVHVGGLEFRLPVPGDLPESAGLWRGDAELFVAYVNEGTTFYARPALSVFANEVTPLPLFRVPLGVSWQITNNAALFVEGGFGGLVLPGAYLATGMTWRFDPAPRSDALALPPEPRVVGPAAQPDESIEPFVADAGVAEPIVDAGHALGAIDAGEQAPAGEELTQPAQEP